MENLQLNGNHKVCPNRGGDLNIMRWNRSAKRCICPDYSTIKQRLQNKMEPKMPPQAALDKNRRHDVTSFYKQLCVFPNVLGWLWSIEECAFESHVYIRHTPLIACCDIKLWNKTKLYRWNFDFFSMFNCYHFQSLLLLFIYWQKVINYLYIVVFTLLFTIWWEKLNYQRKKPT